MFKLLVGEAIITVKTPSLANYYYQNILKTVAFRGTVVSSDIYKV